MDRTLALEYLKEEYFTDPSGITWDYTQVTTSTTRSSPKVIDTGVIAIEKDAFR